MSRPYEEALANRLVRLNGLITESEAMLSRTNDDETHCKVTDELTRQRELREHYTFVLQRTKLLNRIAARAHVTFWTAFAFLFAIGFGPFSPTLTVPLALFDLLILLASVAVFIGALVARDMVAHGLQLWRFSLRTLFVITTELAVGLALLRLALRM